MLKINFCQLLEGDWRNEDEKEEKITKVHKPFLSIVRGLTTSHPLSITAWGKSDSRTSHLLFPTRLEVGKRGSVKKDTKTGKISPENK